MRLLIGWALLLLGALLAVLSLLGMLDPVGATLANDASPHDPLGTIDFSAMLVVGVINFLIGMRFLLKAGK